MARLVKKLILIAGALAAINSPIMNNAHAQSTKPNHLQGVESPYLRQHVYNVVDWYPWGPEALEKARKEGKPIFLSIGYSTCHWCHVMARESFDDEKIGKFLNDNFVAIKIDRERRPDLDEQFMLVTQVISGSGGWPNSVFLTNKGEPFFAGTYFPPDAFTRILNQVNGLWLGQRADVNSEAGRISGIIRNYMKRTEAAKDLTPEVIRNAAKSVLSQVDEFTGGFGVAPKFPQESLLLFLLDQAEREGDRELLKIVTDALDGMLKGGIHDHVGGGFHRYSVDAHWSVPHFEKMLYNQAMIGRLMVRAWSVTGNLRYKRTAIRTFDYVLREMQDESGGFYSAQDADSLDDKGEEVEGYFYSWKPDEVAKLLGEDSDFVNETMNIESDGNFEGANVLRLNELPEELAAEKSITEQVFYDRLDAHFEKLRVEREKRPAPHKDKKILVAWNAMMAVTLAQAGHVFDRPEYYESARKSVAYIMKDMAKDGELYRVSFEGSIGVEAQLPDYAGLGLAFLALHDYAPKDVDTKPYLEQASKLAVELARRYKSQDGENSALRMTTSSDGIGEFFPIDDTEIPSGNALALSLFSGLSKRSESAIYLQSATLLSAALSGHALSSPSSRSYSLKSAHALSHGEIGQVRSLANGAVLVSVNRDRNAGKISFDIRIKEGWHINAHKPLEDYFLPTQLEISDTPIDKQSYPAPLVKELKFNGNPVAVYEGNVTLEGKVRAGEAGKPAPVALLKLQACSDKICLPPEETAFRLW